LFRRQLRGEVGPVAEDQRPHFVIYRLDHIEGFNLATDGRKFFCRKYTASENLNGHGSPRKRPKSTGKTKPRVSVARGLVEGF
jgi:hypothetical protein